MRGRQAASWLASETTHRLDRLARQWRPASAGGSVGSSDLGPALPYPDAGDAALPSDPWRSLSTPAPDEPAGGLRWGPWNRPALRGLAIVIALAVVVTAWWAWSGRPREVVAAPTVLSTGVPMAGIDPATEPPAPAPSPQSRSTVVVHVVGQVRHPGVVTLAHGSRVADAVDAAGGVSKKGADDSVNLARVLVDGEQVIVGFAAQAVAGALGLGSSAPTAASSLLNLNSADAAAFEQLPGVGPVLAERIVEWRSTNGPFRSVDELGEVSGIGDAIMGEIRALVTV